MTTGAGPPVDDDRLVTLHPIGRNALLVEIAPAASGRVDITALDTQLRRQDISGVVDIVPAEDTLLVTTAESLDDPRFVHLVDLITASAHAAATAITDASISQSVETVEIPVVYNGTDLEQVARAGAMSVTSFIEAHTTADFTVAFCGFAPGFAYLTGLPEALRLPRRPSPRPQVPAGSVAIAEHYCAVYPRSSPGGWHLVGLTDRVLFDPQATSPALLQPGMRVRFTAIPDRIEITAPEPKDDNRDRAAGPSPPVAIRVLHAGASCLIEDLGRPGWGRVAVNQSGAWDRRSHRLAQRLVGNPEAAAGLECLGGGLRLQIEQSTALAVTGAPGPLTILRDGVRIPASTFTTVHLRPGDEVHVGHPVEGLRRYLAFRGGLAATEVLGSTSTDTLSGLGPSPVATGDPLDLLTATGEIPVNDLGLADPIRTEGEVIPTPIWSRLTPQSRRRLAEGVFTVGTTSDRIGVRLEGEPLEWSAGASGISRETGLASRPMVRGAIQLPPDGRPVVLGPDHPATGGYPVIGVLADPDAPAQWAPGVTVRLREVVPFLLAPRAASSTGRAADS